MGKPQAITVNEAMFRLSLGRTTINKLIREKALKSTTIGKRRLILVDSMDDLLGGEGA